MCAHNAVCAGLVGSHVALASANLTSGFAFSGLLLPGRSVGIPHVAFAVFNTAALWAISSVLGFTLANA